MPTIRQGRSNAAVSILVEPLGKNTLPSIYYGLQCIAKDDVSSIVAILPSDHLDPEDSDYSHAFEAAEKIAKDYLVVFGRKPVIPHTGFGYILPGKPVDDGFVVQSFVEKPDYETAVRYIQEGYLWNSGMFVVRTDLFF